MAWANATNKKGGRRKKREDRPSHRTRKGRNTEELG